MKPVDDIMDEMESQYIRKQRSQLSRNERKKTKAGRNDPCPCGSGDKFKICCMRKGK